MLQKIAIIVKEPLDSLGFYFNMILVRKALGGCRPVYRPETAKNSPQRTSLSHVYYRLSSGYYKKREIRIQNRSGGCTDPPGQPEVPPLHLHVQSVLASGTSLQSKHSSPGVHLPGAHCSGLPPSSRDISTTLSRRLVSLPPKPSGTNYFTNNILSFQILYIQHL